MKNLILALVTSLAIPALAQAERFILKNPKAPVLAKTVETLRFGEDTYLIVEAPKFANLLASFSRSAEHVSEEYQIGLPAGEVQSSVPAGRRAWHIDALKYSSLPQLRDGRNITVAVLDTGVDYDHQALKAHIWSNAKECAAGNNGRDNDGNGFVNDCHGYDFDQKDADPMDFDRHGTHCAGIIAASPDTDSGAQGVAPGVKIMAVRIIGSEQRGFLSNAAAGIKYAVDNGAKVLSNSWRLYKSWSSFDPSDVNIQLLRAAIKYAGDRGAIFVAAAGNETVDVDTSMTTDPIFPAGFDGLPNLIVVAASDESGDMASFSNYGAGHVGVAAPGNNIISTVPGGGWTSLSGTSMAAPLVAGSMARGLSAFSTASTVIDKLISTSVKSPAWTNKVRSGGVIDLTRYLAD